MPSCASWLKSKECVNIFYGAPIPKEDYDFFVGPYESKKTLDAIRKNKKPEKEETT
jgi:hypothetical protein